MLGRIGFYLRELGVPALIGAVRGRLSGTPSQVSVRPAGCAHPFCLRIPSSDVPTYRQVFIDYEYRFSAQEDPAVIVDAGANIGLAAIYFANRFTNARIISLEPESTNFELLVRNVSPYPNIVPVKAALWDRNGEIDLVDPGRGQWGFMGREKDDDMDSSGVLAERVQAITVDRLMEEHSLDRINLLKCDIEGSEREVFRDPAAWIDRVDAMIVELHDRNKPGCSRSFYNGSNGFDVEWMRGENVFVSRADAISRAD